DVLVANIRRAAGIFSSLEDPKARIPTQKETAARARCLLKGPARPKNNSERNEGAMEEKQERGARQRLPDEVRAAIAKEDPRISHEELARKYDCSGVTVLAIRKEFGVWNPRKKHKAGANKAKA